LRGRVHRHLSFANVASALALFLAVGGGTTAIALSGRNSVDSGDLKAGAVKTSDLARNAVTGRKVKESSLGIVPDAIHAEDADKLDGFAGAEYQLGNGQTVAIVGGVEDGPTFGLVDLGSATLRIDCEDTDVTLNVKDDAGAPVPTAAAPTDVWIGGEHSAIVADGGSTPGVVADASDSTTPVQIWSTDDIVSDATFNVFFDGVADLCVIDMPLTQNFPVGSPANQSAGGDRGRAPLPRTSGILPR
jgi:hypothetical protein